MSELIGCNRIRHVFDLTSLVGSRSQLGPCQRFSTPMSGFDKMGAHPQFFFVKKICLAIGFFSSNSHLGWEVKMFISDVDRKPTHTHQYLVFDSHYPLQHWQRVMRNLPHWADNVPTSAQAQEKEHNHLKDPLKTCDYPTWTFYESSHMVQEEHQNYRWWRKEE